MANSRYNRNHEQDSQPRGRPRKERPRKERPRTAKLDVEFDATDRSPSEKHVAQVKPAAFPSLSHVEAPGESNGIWQDGRHGIAKLVEERSDKDPEKLRRSCEQIDFMYSNKEFPPHMSEDEKRWYIDLKDHLAVGNSEAKISFHDLWPSLRQVIIDTIREECANIYCSAYYPVTCLLHVEASVLYNIMKENCQVWTTDDDIPDHILQLKRQFPNEPIDPDTPPPQEIVKAIKFLKQMHLPACLLGEWQFPLSKLEVCNPPLPPNSPDHPSTFNVSQSAKTLTPPSPARPQMSPITPRPPKISPLKDSAPESQRSPDPQPTADSQLTPILQPALKVQQPPKQQMTQEPHTAPKSPTPPTPEHAHQQHHQDGLKPNPSLLHTQKQSAPLPESQPSITPGKGPVLGLWSAPVVPQSVNRIQSSQQAQPAQAQRRPPSEMPPPPPRTIENPNAKLAQTQSLDHQHTRKQAQSPTETPLPPQYPQISSLRGGYTPSPYEYHNLFQPRPYPLVSSPYGTQLPNVPAPDFTEPPCLSTYPFHQQQYGMYANSTPSQPTASDSWQASVERQTLVPEQSSVSQHEAGVQHQNMRQGQFISRTETPFQSASVPWQGLYPQWAPNPSLAVGVQQQPGSEHSYIREDHIDPRIHNPYGPTSAPRQMPVSKSAHVTQQQQGGYLSRMRPDGIHSTMPVPAHTSASVHQHQSVPQQATVHAQQAGGHYTHMFQGQTKFKPSAELRAQYAQYLNMCKTQNYLPPKVRAHLAQRQNCNKASQAPQLPEGVSKNGMVTVRSVQDVNKIMGTSRPLKRNLEEMVKNDPRILFIDPKRMKNLEGPSERVDGGFDVANGSTRPSSPLKRGFEQMARGDGAIENGGLKRTKYLERSRVSPQENS